MTYKRFQSTGLLITIHHPYQKVYQKQHKHLANGTKENQCIRSVTESKSKRKNLNLKERVGFHVIKEMRSEK